MRRLMIDLHQAVEVKPYKGYNPHRFFKQHEPYHYLLFIESTLPGGGASVNKDVLDWYRATTLIPEHLKEIFFWNKLSDWKKPAIVDELPEKPVQTRIKNNRTFEYYTYDSTDFPENESNKELPVPEYIIAETADYANSLGDIDSLILEGERISDMELYKRIGRTGVKNPTLENLCTWAKIHPFQLLVGKGGVKEIYWLE